MKSMSEYIFKMLSKFSEVIEEKVSECENKLQGHIKLLDLKIKEMEAKLKIIEDKTIIISDTLDKILAKSDSKMKIIGDSKFKIEKIIQEINSKVERLNQRVKNQESYNLNRVKYLQTSIIRKPEDLNIAKNMLIDITKKESTVLNNDQLYQKRFERIAESLSSIDLSNSSSFMLRLRSKCLKVKGELKQLELDIFKIIELI